VFYLESTYVRDAKIFKAFCDENRLMVLESLRSGEKCACALIEILGIGQSALSYHMKILVESGIVSARQEGKWTHYSISEAGSARAIELLHEITTPSGEQQEDICCG
jgi:ArsR family transcriptional regulator